MTLLATQPFMRAAAGGGAGAGGITFRSPVDTFNGADRAAAETARDAAITDTAPFDADPTLGIILTWPATPTNTVYQVRRNSAWVDISVVAKGDTGNAGRNGAAGGGAWSLLGSYSHTADDHAGNIFVATGITMPANRSAFAYRLGGTLNDLNAQPGLMPVDAEILAGRTAASAGDTAVAANRVRLPEYGGGGSVGGSIFGGITSAGELLIATSNANQDFAIAVYDYVPSAVQGGRTDAEIQALIDATNLSALQGQVTDGQVPATIARDAEIAGYARATSPTGTIPDAQIPATIARDAEIATYARTTNPTGTIPDAQVPAAIARDAEIATYARTTNPTGTIPDAQIPDGITRDTEAAAAYAALTGATFTGAVVVPAATADENPIRKDTFDALVARVAALEGTAPVGTHTRYAAFSPDATFDETEWLAGNTSMTNSIEFPATTVQHYKGFAIPATETSLTDIRQAGSAFNTRNAYDPDVGEDDVLQDIDGVSHKTYIAKAPDFAGTAEDFVLS